MNKVTISISIVFMIVVSWIFYLTNFKQDSSLTVRYYSVAELSDISSQLDKVKVGGYIKPNSIIISEDDQLDASFFVYQNNDSVKVSYYGIRPDLFKDDAEVVVSARQVFWPSLELLATRWLLLSVQSLPFDWRLD